jgi:hypothetical protein
MKATVSESDAGLLQSRASSGHQLGALRRALIGQTRFASTAAGRGPRVLALVRGPDKDQPLPTVVRCRERRQDVAPTEGLVYEQSATVPPAGQSAARGA